MLGPKMMGSALCHPHDAAQAGRVQQLHVTWDTRRGGGGCSELPNAAFGTPLMAVPMTVKGDRMAVGNYVISHRIILCWGCCCLRS